MLDAAQWKLLVASYPGLSELDAGLAARLTSQGRPFRARGGVVLFEEKDFCTAYPLIVAGTVRAVKSGASGKEILLYRVRAGEHCLLSAIGLVAGWRHSGRAVAEGTTAGVVVPGDLFRAMMRSGGRFSADVYMALARRVDVLVGLIEQISLLNIHQRLAALLLASGREVRATQQELADDLGCARENLSRALGRLRRQGFVRVERSRIAVLDVPALSSIATAKEPEVAARPRRRSAARPPGAHA